MLPGTTFLFVYFILTPGLLIVHLKAAGNSSSNITGTGLGRAFMRFAARLICKPPA